MTARDRAEELLLELLVFPTPARQVLELAEAAGISPRTLRRAKKALKVQVQRIGFGRSGSWWWKLPPEAFLVDRAETPVATNAAPVAAYDKERDAARFRGGLPLGPGRGSNPFRGAAPTTVEEEAKPEPEEPDPATLPYRSISTGEDDELFIEDVLP